MNKDLDERLIPDGEYRDAVNIQVSSTEGSDAGTIQNILGNEQLPIDAAAATKVFLDFGSNAECVGSIEDDDKGIIYIFLKGNTVNGIVEYNVATKIIRPLIIDATASILKFGGNKITGICILEETLFFTDGVGVNDGAEPKAIDIRPVDSNYDSIFKDYYNLDANKANFIDTTQINGANFKLEDITVISPKPRNAPTVSITALTASTATNKKNVFEDKFVRFGYRWKFKNNQYSVISHFTEPVFDPNLISGTTYDLENGFNNKMLNNIGSITLSDFDISASNLKSVDILYKEANNTNIYIYKTIETPSDLSSGLTITKESVYSVLPENQLLRHYDNVPFKAKALDAVGNRLVFGNYIDGLNLNDYSPNFNVGVGLNTKFETRDAISGTNESAKRTIKSGRNYQIGIAFEDQFGRQTPVLSNDSGLIKRNYGVTAQTTSVVADNANDSKQLAIKMAGDAPSDSRITHFKFYIKDSAAEYYNLIVDSAYEDNEDPNFLWVAFPSYEVNKIKEDDEIILKKTGLGTAASSVSGYTVDNATFKILDISESAPVNTSVPEKKRGVFYAKIKNNSFLTTNLLNTQGSGGFNSVIEPQSASNAPSGALNLGFNDYHGDRMTYYYKDGVIYEVESRTQETSDVSNLPQSGTNITLAAHISAGAHSSCTISGNTEDWYSAVNDSQTTQAELTAAGVSAIFYQVNGPAIEKAFICYGASASATEPVPAIFETIPDENILDIYYETEKSYPIDQFNNTQKLLWYNAFKFGDGVESNRIRDDFNETQIDTQVRVSTTVDEGFKERNNTSGLIYSGLFNANNGVNNLNEFNTGVKITKNLNTEYGDIQKLFTRNTDIIAFCEEKVLRVLANKDALFNADGNVNLVSTNNVLGQAVAYNGDYGIAKNPESFACYGNVAYFTDKINGAVIRLSQDGLTLISDKGMSAFFRNNLAREAGNIIGSYDVYSNQYILTMPTFGSSFSFKEDSDGWPSKLSFLPHSALSLKGEYYSCFEGQLYLHNAPGTDRNTFYGQYTPSAVQLIFNQEPSVIKNFKNLSYEGTTGWKTDTDQTGAVFTDQQDGQIIEFKEKEGKYFGLISGIDTKLDKAEISSAELSTRLKDFSIQGLGNISAIVGAKPFTCTDAGFAIADSNTTTDGTTAITSLSKSTVTAGTIKSVSPTNMVVGSQGYTATITVPNGFSNSGGTIDCNDNATGTAVTPTFTCTTAALTINNGTVGATVTGSVSAGTISSFTPNTYQLGSFTYTAVIAAPGSGYTNNSANVSCTGTATGNAAVCGYTLAHDDAYANGGTTITGSNFGSSYTDSDTISLTASSGNICIGGGCTASATSVNTTKSALAGGIVIRFTEGTATVTAVTTGGLCSDTKILELPESGFSILGGGAAFTYDSHILTAAHPSTTLTSFQWHKSASSGFTPSTSTAIAGANSLTFDATQEATGTVYYKVFVNGATNSSQKAVVFSNRPQLSGLKFTAGGAVADPSVCTSDTTKNVFVKPLSANLETATEFFSDVTGNKSSLVGTYSATISGTAKYRFVSSTGIPSPTSPNCGTAGDAEGDSEVQKVKVKDCRNTISKITVDVTLPANQNTLAVGNVISFTSSIGSNSFFHVTDINVTGTADHSRTLSATHTSCLVADPPTIDLTGSVTVFAGASISLNAQPAFTPQGATFTYIYRKSTDGSTPSDVLSTTTNANVTDTAPTTAGTNKYTVEIQSTSPLIKSDPPKEVSITAYHAHELQYASGGSISDSACTATGTTKDVFANINYIAGTITQLYTSAAGSTSGFALGTYSDGNIHGYFNSSGVLQNQWLSCPIQASPSVVIRHPDTSGSAAKVENQNPFAAVVLVADFNDAFGPNKTFSWTKAVTISSLGTSSSSSFGGNTSSIAPTLSDTEKNGIGTGMIQHTYGVTVNDGTNSDTDIIEVEWQGVEQQVAVTKCVGGGTYYAKITNSSGWPVNAVLDLQGSGFDNGCYKVTDNNSTGQTYTSVIVGGGYPFTFTAIRTCCQCSTCTVTTSGSNAGTLGTDVEITVGTPSGFTVASSGTIYRWYRKVGFSGNYEGPLTEYDNDASPTFNETGSPADYYYRVDVYGTNATSSGHLASTEHQITWSQPTNPTTRSFQMINLLTDCSGTEGGGQIAYGRITSFITDAAANEYINRVASLEGNTTTCFEIQQEVAHDTSYPILRLFVDCNTCYTNLTRDCNMSLSVGNTYDSINGTADFTGVFGTSAAATDTITLEATDGSLVNPTSTTVSALQGTLTVDIGSGKTLRATITSGTCSTGPQTSATRQAPSAACHAITVHYTTSNPATDSTAKANLCGGGPTETRRFNASSLSLATQVFSSRNDCTTGLSSVRYFSTDNTNYYVWNGSSLSNAIPLNCSASGNIQ